MSRIEAIKQFFQSNGGRKVENSELLFLKQDDPKAFTMLAEEAAKEMGVTLDS